MPSVIYRIEDDRLASGKQFFHAAMRDAIAGKPHVLLGAAGWELDHDLVDRDPFALHGISQRAGCGALAGEWQSYRRDQAWRRCCIQE